MAMKVSHITTHSIKEAWEEANKIFPTDYELNNRASKNAGYDIWWSTSEGCVAWISDLGNRLEVNLQNGDTVNIWIEEEENTEETITTDTVKKWNEATETVKGMNIEPIYDPEVCQKVTLCIDGNYGNEEQKQIYEAIKSGHHSILFDLLTRYAETHGIKWGHMWGCEARHYEHGKTGKGHYIVSGYISGTIGEEINFITSCANLLQRKAEKYKKD